MIPRLGGGNHKSRKNEHLLVSMMFPKWFCLGGKNLASQNSVQKPGGIFQGIPGCTAILVQKGGDNLGWHFGWGSSHGFQL